MIIKANITGWKWRFISSKCFELSFYYWGAMPLVIRSRKGNVLASLEGNQLVIERHFHFDGATLAPDFAKVLPACALHDALLQLNEAYPKAITETRAHESFKKQMQKDGFILWPVYYWAVSGWPRKLYKLLTK